MRLLLREVLLTVVVALVVSRRATGQQQQQQQQQQQRFINDVESVGSRWLAEYSSVRLRWQQGQAESRWQYVTDVTNTDKRRRFTEFMDRYSQWRKQKVLEARQLLQVPLHKNETAAVAMVASQLVSQDPRLDRELRSLRMSMEHHFATAKVCLATDPSDPSDPSDHCLSLDPDLSRVMSHSRSPGELKAVWSGWHQAVGGGWPASLYYSRLIQASNRLARENGFRDMSAVWKSTYPGLDLDSTVTHLWAEIEPFYRKLHEFVRRKLTKYYGREVVGEDGMIPVHLTGNMWGQSWASLMDIVQGDGVQGDNVQSDNVQGDLKHSPQAATTDKMPSVSPHDAVLMADKFYQSLGFPPLPPQFWQQSVLTSQTKDEVVECHPQAVDMFTQNDVRMKSCGGAGGGTVYTEVEVAHHEVGHLQYYLAYQHLDTLWRDSPTPALHEVIGDTCTLSLAAPGHLHRAAPELFPPPTEPPLQTLLRQALDKLPLIAFSVSLERWRWSVLEQQDITHHMYNTLWWKYRRHYQGVRPPTDRSESEVFDPISKYHVAAHTPYIGYFLSAVLQFQVHSHLCEATGQHVLHTCDIYGHKEAGRILRSAMSVGSSQDWRHVLKTLTGETQISADYLLRYFRPLISWLDNQLNIAAPPGTEIKM